MQSGESIYNLIPQPIIVPPKPPMHKSMVRMCFGFRKRDDVDIRRRVLRPRKLPSPLREPRICGNSIGGGHPANVRVRWAKIVAKKQKRVNSRKRGYMRGRGFAGNGIKA